ncbi:hypothetical protein RI570_11330, partial [Brucella pseudogrignonensis]|nr:hypothetical protein [Brucella pseudogrignonensis]
MVTPIWPRSVLKPKRASFNIASRTLAGPSSVSGLSQVSASDAGIWKATFADIIIKRGSSAVLAYRAIAMLLEGKLHPILLSALWCLSAIRAGLEQACLRAFRIHDTSPFSDAGLYRSRAIDIRLISNIP